VSDLESLEAVTALSFLSHYIKDRVNKFGSLCVVTLGPVITSTSLSEDKVIGAEKLAERARADRVHGTRLQIHEDSARDITSSCGFIVVHIDAL
jgi:proteasome assembly chaperone (PAC2) family protein